MKVGCTGRCGTRVTVAEILVDGVIWSQPLEQWFLEQNDLSGVPSLRLWLPCTWWKYLSEI